MADVTGSQGQESTGEDLPRVRHEHESLAVIDTGLPLNDLGANLACPGLSCSFSLSPLRHEPAIMLRFGGLDIEWRALRQIVEEGENLFILFRSEVLGRRRASRRYQEEHAPQLRTRTLHQVCDLAQAANIVSR